MNVYIDRAFEFVTDTRGDIWNWFGTLNREEWIVVLAVGAASGFICMLGHGSRTP